MKKHFLALILAFSGLFIGLLLFTTIQAGSPSSGLAVTPKDFDDIGEVLQRLGFSAKEITIDTLRDARNLQGYRAVYINCSQEWDPGAWEGEAPGETEARKERIKQAAVAVREYVKNGGFVYASDYAASIIDAAFPGKIDFYGTEITDAMVGYPGRQTAAVVDAGLAAVVGKKTLEIEYDQPAWVIIDKVAPGVRVYVTGAAPIGKFREPPEYIKDPVTGDEKGVMDFVKNTGNKPYVVAFNEGKGAVLYTTFHNEKQITADMDKMVKWFAVWAKGGKARQAVSVATADAGAVIKEIIDSINAGETKKYPFDAPGGNVQISLGTAVGKLGLTVKDGKGKVIIDKKIEKFDFFVKAGLPGAKGSYTVEVKGLQVPEQNMPFAVTISKEGKPVQEEVTAMFSFPKKSYKVGEVVDGTVWFQHVGKSAPFKIVLPRFGRKNTMEAVNQKFPPKGPYSISIKAEKPGDLVFNVTVTKPGDKRFKKVFNHKLRVEQAPAPQSSGSKKTVGSCPLTVELVQKMCKLSAPLQPTKSVKDCSIVKGQEATTIAEYSSHPYDGNFNKLIQQETNNRETGFQEIRGVGERAFIAGVVPINAVSLLFGEGTKYDTTLYNETGFSLVVVKGTTAHYFSANGLETLTLPAGCSVDEMKELAKTIIK